MVDYAVLKDELTTDPLMVGYASMDSAQAADALNALTRTRIVETHVNAKDVLSKLGVTSGGAFLDALESIAAGNSAVKWVLSFITSDSGVNVGDNETRAMLDQLSTDDILNAQDAATIKALAEESISRATEIGLGKITEGDVAFARSL